MENCGKTPGAGGPFTIQIKGFNEISYKNVMIGEVWLCSGQSNMEWAISGINDRDEEITKAKNPNVRFFSVFHSSATSHQSFAWRNTATPNLFNGANLPASCFLTE